MSSQSIPDVYLAIFSAHDFLFFSSSDYNTVSVMEEVIGDHALCYALNRHVESIHRAFSGTKPFYNEDLPKITLYSSPAYRLRDFFQITRSKKFKSSKSPVASNTSLIKDFSISWESTTLETHKYNSTGESFTFGMEKSSMNFPNLGTYQKFPPLTTFVSFVFGAPRPSLIRLGKKLVPCRLHYFKLIHCKIKKGIFTPNHPVNAIDVKARYDLIKGEIILVKPNPIVINATLEGEYIEGSCNNEKFQFCLPNFDYYENIAQ